MKKLLHKLDQVKTPDGWAEDVINKAKNLSPEQAEKIITNHKRKITYKVVLLVAALVTISSTSIFAAFKINQTYKTQNTAQSMNHFDTVIDANGNQYTYEGGQTIDQSEVKDDLNVTCTKMSADNHSACIQFSVATKDGSPLIESTETKVSIPARQTFQIVVIKVDDKIISKRSLDSYYYFQRVDDASQPDKATFELKLRTNNFDLAGKNISVNLENYQDVYYEYKDFGFKYATIEDLAKQGTLASEDDFLPSNKEKYNMDEGMKLLNPGSNRIYFSSKYSDAYIDNMGFAPAESDNDICFYLTIVPGSEENAIALQKLVFQNLTTGMPNTICLASRSKISGDTWVTKKETLPDGRIEIALDISRDSMYNPDGNNKINTTKEHLSNYTIKYNNDDDGTTDIKYKGSWNFKFNVNSDKMNSVIDKDVNVTVTETKTNTHSIKVNHIKLTGSKLSIIASIVNLETWSFDEFPIVGTISSPYLILKDGTKLSAGSKADGSSNTGQPIVLYGWELQSLVDPSQVKSIEWYGVTIDLQ